MRNLTFAALAVCLTAGVAQAQDAEPKIQVEIKQLKTDGQPAFDNIQTLTLPAYWVGVGVEPISDVLAVQLGLKHGLVADVVSDGSPAAKAGIRMHDILLKFNGSELHTISDLIQGVAAVKEQQVDVELLRKGKKLTLAVTPAKRPEGEALAPPSAHFMEQHSELQELLNKAMKEQGGLGRFMVVRPPVFEHGAKMPKTMKFSIRKENGEERVEVEMNGEKFEADSIEKLPARVRKYLDFNGRKNLNDAFSMQFKPHVLKDQDESLRQALSKLQEQVEAMQKELDRLQQDK